MCCCLFFFFHDTSTTEIYTSLHTLALHDALPICCHEGRLLLHPSFMPRNWPDSGFCPTADARCRAGQRSLSGSGFGHRSEEHTSELQSLMRISYAVFCLKKKKKSKTRT